jgi:trimeric autotransporter adhesin
MSTLPTTVRDDALNLSTDLAQAGVVFNDSTRLLDGGLWSTPADSNNQAAYLGMYTTDINAVLDDVNAVLANPNGVTISGNAYTLSSADTGVLSQVQGQLQTLLNEATHSVGDSHSATTAQELIHTTQTSILNEINSDPTLAAALGANPYPSGTGATNVGFESLPTGSDNSAALTAASAPGATLAQIGNVFNAAADLAVGGLNQSNLSEFNADMKAISTGLTNLVNNPTALSAIESAAGETGSAAALTTIHLETALNQINLQISDFDPKYASDPNIAARSTNDNLLDIIDIVQNDPALNTAAGGNGTPAAVGGFAEFPAYLNGPDGPNAHGGTIDQYQDNQAQTNFWAQFLAEANTINNQLVNVAAGNNTTPGELQGLITEIQNYQKFGASFDASQGGVFGARFDNELLSGTLLTDTNNAVKGLQGILNGDTGAALAADQAQIEAAGQGFVADANDVSGNNVPIGGGTFVGTSTTVAGATSPSGVAQGTIPVSGAASGSTGLGVAQNGNGAGRGNGNGAGGGDGYSSHNNPGFGSHGNGGGDVSSGRNNPGFDSHSNGGGNNDHQIQLSQVQSESHSHFELIWHHA